MDTGTRDERRKADPLASDHQRPLRRRAHSASYLLYSPCINTTLVTNQLETKQHDAQTASFQSQLQRLARTIDGAALLVNNLACLSASAGGWSSCSFHG